MSSAQRIASIYNSRVYILELLEMQGFSVEQYQGFSNSEVDIMFKNTQLDMLVQSPKSGEQMYIKYHLDKPIRKEMLNNIVEDLFETPQNDTNEPVLKKTDTLVIITDDEPNDTNIKQCSHWFDASGIFIVIFNIKRLQFNIRKHVLVPKVVRILSETEMDALKLQYGIQSWRQEIPEISRYDPLAMAIFLRPGQILYIERDSPTSIGGIYYRYCV
jgi:DNA-directed RNA polymerase subunit H (RpoH/RPB5)